MDRQSSWSMAHSATGHPGRWVRWPRRWRRTSRCSRTIGGGEATVGIRRPMRSSARSKLTAVAHTLPYDLSILKDNQRGKPLSASRWAAVKVPTLVMDGGKSPAWIRNAMRALGEVLPNAQRQTLDGQNHMIKAAPLA